MRAASISIGWIATLLTLAISPLAAQPLCTKEQIEAYQNTAFDLMPVKCDVQAWFKACDDDCHKAKQELIVKTPNCNVSAADLLSSEPRSYLELCERYRPAPPDIYVPQFSKGLSNCSTATVKEWQKTYGFNSTFGTCGRKVNTTTGCPDACFKTLEEGVRNTPACDDGSGYWWGELNKRDLASCIQARGEKIADNLVVNTILNGDGSKTVGERWSGWAVSANATSPPAARDASAISASSVPLVTALAGWTTVLLVLATGQ